MDDNARRGHRHVVLVVDDDGTERDALKARLRRAGHDVWCARHGRAALQLLEIGVTPCLLLVDVVKPSVSGVELRRGLMYGDLFRHLVVRALPLASSLTLHAIDVEEVAVDVQRALAAECVSVAAFHRMATPRAPMVPAVRPAFRRRANS